MHRSWLAIAAMVVWLATGGVPALMAPAQAEGMAAEGKDAMKGTGKSVTESAGKLKTDATKTAEDAKALDLEKTKQGTGQVKQDAKDLKDSAKDTMKNPMGTLGK